MRHWIGKASFWRVCACVATLTIGLSSPCVAQPGEAASADGQRQADPYLDGQSSVDGQLESDTTARESAFRFEGFSRSLAPYYELKARIKDRTGLAFGADYNLLYQYASQSLGEDQASGGVFRFFGTWALLDRGTANDSKAGVTDLSSFLCKDIMRMSGDDRIISLSLLNGYFLGKKGTTSFVPGSMGKASDDFTEYCLDHPEAKALDAFAKFAK